MTTKPEWTAGPWKQQRMADGSLHIMAPHPDLGSIGIAKITQVPAECLDNAALITSAPDLYEALAELVAAHQDDPERDVISQREAITDAWDAARAVLRKARVPA